MAELRFDGLTAVVLGGGNGLGRQHALLLASLGARVLVNDIGCSVEGDGRSADAANSTVDEIRRGGGEAAPSTTSGTSQEGATAIVEEAKRAFGPVDIIVNSAGIAAELPIVDMTAELVEAHLNVSVKLPMFIAQAAWPSMRERRMGRIVNTTSGAGLYGRKGNSAYAASKMGLVGVTRALALEGAEHNIHVNALAPAAATRNSYYLPEPMKTWFETECPPERVAPIAAWLVHPECTVNGAIVCTAGGRVARAMMCETAVSEPLLSIDDVSAQLEKVLDSGDLRIPESAHVAMRAYGAPV